MQNKDLNTSSRRGFLGTLATGAAALGAATLATPLMGTKPVHDPAGDLSDADAWFKQIKGKHRIVFDAPRPHDIYPFAWPKVFLMARRFTA